MPLAECPTWRGRMHAWAFAVSIPAGVLLILSARPRSRAHVGVHLCRNIAPGVRNVGGLPPARSHRSCPADHAAARPHDDLPADRRHLCARVLGCTPACVGDPDAVGRRRARAHWHDDQTRRVPAGSVGRLRPLSDYGLGIGGGVSGPRRQPVRSAARVDLAGGLAYTIGFPVLLVKRPNPWPTVFGYHEVWHSFTVLAAALHFAAVSSVLA